MGSVCERRQSPSSDGSHPCASVVLLKLRSLMERAGSLGGETRLEQSDISRWDCHATCFHAHVANNSSQLSPPSVVLNAFYPQRLLNDRSRVHGGPGCRPRTYRRSLPVQTGFAEVWAGVRYWTAPRFRIAISIILRVCQRPVRLPNDNRQCRPTIADSLLSVQDRYN